MSSTYSKAQLLQLLRRAYADFDRYNYLEKMWLVDLIKENFPEFSEKAAFQDVKMLIPQILKELEDSLKIDCK